MNVVFASDNNYAEVVGVALISLLEHHRDVSDMHIYILENQISSENKKRINGIFEKYTCEGSFIPLPDLNRLAGIEIDAQRWSLSTFSRLFMGSLLPDYVDRVIYLDCDILVLDSLKELWETPLLGNLAGGVADCISNGHKANIGLKGTDIYINAGVLLLDLKRWRTGGYENKCVQYISQRKGKIPYVDQGVLNHVLNGKILQIPPRYNLYAALYDFSYENLIRYRKPNFFYTKEEIQTAKEHAAVVHFTSSFLSLRPWVAGSRHPYAEQWLQIKKQSPWRGQPLQQDCRSGLKKAYEKFYHTMPLRFSVWLSGLLHSDLLPKLR